MKEKHSDQWELLKLQGRLYHKTSIIHYSIIILLIVALILSNVFWFSRYNNETASHTDEVIAAMTEQSTATVAVPARPQSRRKESTAA